MRSVSVHLDAKRNRSTNTREQLADITWCIDKNNYQYNIQRIAVAEKYRPIYERQAKENMSLGGKNYSPKEGSQNSSTLPKEDKIDVRAKLAKTVSVSTDTYSKGEKNLL